MGCIFNIWSSIEATHILYYVLVKFKLFLFQTTKMTGRMFGGDLESAVAILRTVANRLQYLLQTQSDSFYNKESYVQQVFQNVLRSASNLLSDENRSIWLDLHPSQRMKTVTALLLALEENAFLLAEVTNAPEIIQETSNSIGKLRWR